MLIHKLLKPSLCMVRVRGLEPPEYSFLDCPLCHSSTPAYLQSFRTSLLRSRTLGFRSCTAFTLGMSAHPRFTTIPLLRNSEIYLIGWLDLLEEYIGETLRLVSALTTTSPIPYCHHSWSGLYILVMYARLKVPSYRTSWFVNTLWCASSRCHLFATLQRLGEGERARTSDQKIKGLLLYQLSYTPIFIFYTFLNFL